MGSIIAAIIVGAIIGACARLVMPGHQNVSVVMTIVLGILGSALGSWLTHFFGYRNSNGGFQIIPFIVGVVVAAALIAAYLSVTKGNSRI